MSSENPSNREQSNIDQDTIQSAIDLLKQQLETRAQMGIDFSSKKSENLQRRLRGEISGVELDRLDAEFDEAIEYNRREMNIIRDRINGTVELLNPENSKSEAATQSEVSVAEHTSQESSPVALPTVTELAPSPYKEDLQLDLSLRDIMGLIAKHGDITASDGYIYKKEDLLSIVGNLRGSNDPNLQRVTNTYGLRDRVRIALMKSEFEQKHNSK
jgi:hypothetical protein